MFFIQVNGAATGGFMKSAATDVTCPGKAPNWVDYNGNAINPGQTLPISVTECPSDDDEGVKLRILHRPRIQSCQTKKTQHKIKDKE